MVVGICDWGIGGLGFYNLLRTERPDLDVVYIGDQGVPGYGLFDRHGLTLRLTGVFRTFAKLGVADVVVACNAASTVVPAVDAPEVRGFGIIDPTLAAIRQLPVGKIGLIGGRRTVRSGSYRRALQAEGWDVKQRVAQPLSRLIEDGKASAPDTLDLLTQILGPLRDVDHLVLACTHYIVLEQDVMARVPGAHIVDPATEAWRQFRVQLPSKSERSGSDRFLTTGSAAAMRQQAKVAFGVDAEVEEIRI